MDGVAKGYHPAVSPEMSYIVSKEGGFVNSCNVLILKEIYNNFHWLTYTHLVGGFT